jgi:hypothetical protein
LRGNFPTRSVSKALAKATIRDTLATESFGNPVKRAAKLPIDTLQNISRCARSEFVYRGANVNANTIHRFRHVVDRMTRQVFLHSIAKKLAAGAFSAPG